MRRSVFKIQRVCLSRLLWWTETPRSVRNLFLFTIFRPSHLPIERVFGYNAQQYSIAGQKKEFIVCQNSYFLNLIYQCLQSWHASRFLSSIIYNFWQFAQELECQWEINEGSLIFFNLSGLNLVDKNRFYVVMLHWLTIFPFRVMLIEVANKPTRS